MWAMAVSNLRRLFSLRIYRAWERRNARNMKWMDSLNLEPQKLSRKQLKMVRWRNFCRYYFPSTRAVTEVTILRTVSPERFINVELTDVDGNKCTLWLEGGDEMRTLPVRTITSY